MDIKAKIENLEEQIKSMQDRIDDMTQTVEEANVKPYSKVGGVRDRSQIRPVDLSASSGQVYGGNIVWNDSELRLPPYGTKPAEPTKGYNKHGHSRYAGGALDLNTLEIVEYDVTWLTDPDFNKHCQQFWVRQPTIKKEKKSTSDEMVEKIGQLDLIFNPDKGKWGAVAYEIDVEKTFLVRRDPDTGEIMLDENGEEMKSALIDEQAIDGGGTDNSKSNIVWDKKAKCFRFYAVYADDDTETAK